MDEPAYNGPPPVIATGGVCVLRDEHGRILLVRHTYGRLNWELPGGGAEAGEAPPETAIREMREETGLEVVIDRLTGVYYEAEPRPGTNQGPLLHFAFLAHPTDDRAPVPTSPEIGELGWWPLDALPTPISDFTERRIRDALGGGPAAVVRIGPRRWRE
jgi:8-oxo-dGTP diphosphatase